LWEIETLLSALKSRESALEAVHVTELEEIRKLPGVLVLAYAWT
jgi:predicted RNase H-like HicB family nuclease